MPAHAVPPSETALARVALIAARQGGVVTWRQCVDSGLTASQVRTLVRRGDLEKVGAGLFGRAEPSPLRDVATRLFQVERRAVISHATAGLLHGFPYVDAPSVPTLTVERACRGEPGVYVAALKSADVTSLEGLPVTNAARTLVDLLRTTTGRGAAQALADGALHQHVDVGDLPAALGRARGWPGIRQAREAWRHADPRPESPLESRHRVLLRDAGLPEPELQAPVLDLSGVQVARVDFLFREQRTVVESDGRVKYVDDSEQGVRPRDALWREKLREDRLRDLGFEVVRATWADLLDGGEQLTSRIARAFERSRLRAA